MAVSESRIKTLAKINELESKGLFNIDVWGEPTYIPLKPGQVDYFKKKLSTRIKNRLCNRAVEKFVKKMQKNHQAIIKDIVGIEKLKDLKTGAIITSNHFHPFDSYPVSRMVKKVYGKKKKMHIVVAEYNYAGGTGFYGKIFRNQNTIPIAQNKEVMIECLKAINYYLTKGDFVLVYPEQALWQNYKKPRPLKEGAYRFALKANVPVVACFVTMQDSQYLDGEGIPVQEYTLHILDVIYPKAELSYKENIEYMKNENERLMREKYEEVYGEKLTYNTKEKM